MLCASIRRHIGICPSQYLTGSAAKSKVVIMTRPPPTGRETTSGSSLLPHSTAASGRSLPAASSTACLLRGWPTQAARGWRSGAVRVPVTCMGSSLPRGPPAIAGDSAPPGTTSVPPSFTHCASASISSCEACANRVLASTTASTPSHPSHDSGKPPQSACATWMRA